MKSIPRKWITAFFVSFVVSQSLFAAAIDDDCLPFLFDEKPITLSDVVKIKNQVIQDLYPELKGYKIRLNNALSEPDYFMDTWITPLSVLRHARKRQYWVRLNPVLLDSPPSEKALYGILAHELSHIVDYKKRNSVNLIRFLIWIGKSDPAPYERHTDEVALRKGVAQGLLEYRCWLNHRLTDSQWLKKKRIYYSPAEIKKWLDGSVESLDTRLSVNTTL